MTRIESIELIFFALREEIPVYAVIDGYIQRKIVGASYETLEAEVLTENSEPIPTSNLTMWIAPEAIQLGRRGFKDIAWFRVKDNT